MADTLRVRAQLVDDLSRTIESGEHGLDLVPDLLRRLLKENAWQEFVTRRGTHVRHERFIDFVHAKPLAGLGSDLKVVRRLIADDPDAVVLYTNAVKGQQGTRSDLVDNVNDVPRPDGNTVDAAHRRLEKDRPDLHARVLARELSPHAAMVAAGFRPRTATIRLDDPDAIARTLRKRLDDTACRAVIERLLTDLADGRADASGSPGGSPCQTDATR